MGPTFEVFPNFLDLLLGRLFPFLETDKNCGSMAIGHRHPETLGRNGRTVRLDNFAILNVPPHLQRFLFALFLFAADIGDQIVHHLGPAFEGLACAGNGLIGTGQNRVNLVPCVHQRREERGIALNGAIGLDSDKAPLCAQPFALSGNNFDMVGV